MCKPSCTALLLGGQHDRWLLLLLQAHRGDQRGDGLHLSMQEKLKAVAQDFFGHEVGISKVVKHLRLNEHADLAKAVTAQHKCRNLAAHPASDLDVRVRLAFEKTFFKEDPLMDNDTWKQKVAVKNVDNVVKETCNNDVAAERSETVVALASGTWEPLVLRLHVADTGRHCAACTRKKTRDFSAQVDADAKPPFVDVSTQCRTLDILNCGPLRAVTSVEEHERLLEQVRAYMDAVRPDMERIVKAFGLSVKFVDIAKTSKGISVNVVYQGYTTKGRHCEVQRALVGFLEDHEMNKFTVPISFVPYQDNQRRPLPS